MTTANIYYKLSCFGDYSSITYNKSDVIRVLGEFDNPTFAPSVIQEIAPSGTVSQRMQFSTQNGLFVININSTRIDVTVTSAKKNGFSGHEKSKAKDDLYESMVKILDIINDRVDKPNRLAWNLAYTVFDLTEEEKTKYISKFLKPIDYFKEDPLDDVLIRYSTRKEYALGDQQERINILTTIVNFISAPETVDEIKGFKIDYDINTWQDNKKSRFEPKTIKAFIEKSIEIQNKLNEVMLP